MNLSNTRGISTNKKFGFVRFGQFLDVTLYLPNAGPKLTKLAKTSRVKVLGLGYIFASSFVSYFKIIIIHHSFKITVYLLFIVL
jgi:hypothetical protein